MVHSASRFHPTMNITAMLSSAFFNHPSPDKKDRSEEEVSVFAFPLFSFRNVMILCVCSVTFFCDRHFRPVISCIRSTWQKATETS